jgi:predicted N-formylglutamate amidohydrolase
LIAEAAGQEEWAARLARLLPRAVAAMEAGA